MEKSADAFRTISEVAADLALPQHVLRFWETHFPQIKPLKRAGGRRYYRPADVVLLRAIRDLLHQDGYTIKGVQRLLRKQGARGLRGEEASGGDDLDTELPAAEVGAVGPLVEASFVSVSAGQDDLREALATIEECERILSALRPARG